MTADSAADVSSSVAMVTTDKLQLAGPLSRATSDKRVNKTEVTPAHGAAGGTRGHPLGTVRPR